MPPERLDPPGEYPHVRSISTRWKDNDIYGHVNNVEYYSFFDTVINAWLIEEGGLDIQSGETIGVCAESGCRFVAPVAFPESIEAGLRVGKLGQLQRPVRNRPLPTRRRASGRRLVRPRLRRPRGPAATIDPRGDPDRNVRDHPVKTRAAVLREMGPPAPYAESDPLVATDLTLEQPGKDELLIRVRAAGLCHSDLSVINGSRPRVMPMALGHEAAGQVVETGSADSSFAAGDHVVLAFVPACGECRFCAEGRPALCLPGGKANAAGTLLNGEVRQHDESGTAIHHHLGVSAFSEYIVVSEHSAVKVPEDLPFEIAALFGCAVLTGAGMVLNTAADALPARSVAVFGLGGVGLSALLAAASQGPETLIAVDPVSAKRKLALELGAGAVIDPGEGDAVEQVKAATDGEGVDLAIETAGSEKVLAQAYAATGLGGMTVTAGLPHPDRKLQIQATSLAAEERTLKGSYLGSCVPIRDIPRFIAMYRDGLLPVDRLLSHRLEPGEINEGFDRLDSGEAIRQVLLFE